MGKKLGYSKHWYERLRYGRVLLALTIIVAVSVVLIPEKTSFLEIQGTSNLFTGGFLSTSTKDIYLNPGNSIIIKINITNNYTDAEVVLLNLFPDAQANYIAEFIPHPLGTITNNGRTLTSSYLSPLEQATFELQMKAVVLGVENSQLVINATIAGNTETETLNIHIKELLDFPGMELPAIIFLVVMAGIIYWRKEGRVDSGSYPKV